MENKRFAARGSIMAFLSALLFSCGGVIIKFMPWGAMSINFARNLVACLITLLYMRIIHHRIKINRTVLIGSAAMSGVTITFCFATKLTTSANAILLQYTSPLFLILILWVMFKQRPRRRDLFMCASVGIGILCFFFDSLSSGGMAGNMLALLSGMLYAFVFVFNTVKEGDALSSFFFGEVISSVVGLPFLLKETVFTPYAIMGGAALGIIIGVGYALLAEALKTTPPVAANLIGAVEPVLNPTWVAVFYGETMTPLAVVGFVIVLVSVVLYNFKGKRKN